MARQESRVSVGSFVDPFEGLENAFAGYRKKLDADRKYEDSLARQKEEDRRWALTNARAEQGLQLRKDAAQATKDKLARAEKEREALLAFGRGYTDAAAIAPNLGDTSDRLAKDYEVRARNALAERMMVSPQGDQLKEQTGEFGSVVTQANMPDYEAKSATQRLADLEPDYNKRFNMLYGKDAKDVLGLFSDTSVVSREDETARLMQKALAEGVPLEKAMPTITALASKYRSDKEIQASLDKRADAMYEKEKDANKTRLDTLKANNTGRSRPSGGSSKTSFGGYNDPIGQEEFDRRLFGLFTANDRYDAQEAQKKLQNLHASGGEYNGTSLANIDVKTLNNINSFALQQANDDGDFDQKVYDEVVETALRNSKQFSKSPGRSRVDLDRFVTEQVTMPSAEDYRTRNWTSARDRLLGSTLERRPSADIGIDRLVVENTNTPPIGSGGEENPAVEVAGETNKAEPLGVPVDETLSEKPRYSSFMQRVMKPGSPYYEDNKQETAAEVLKKVLDPEVELMKLREAKRFNPDLDSDNRLEASLNNQLLDRPRVVDPNGGDPIYVSRQTDEVPEPVEATPFADYLSRSLNAFRDTNDLEQKLMGSLNAVPAAGSARVARGFATKVPGVAGNPATYSARKKVAEEAEIANILNYLRSTEALKVGKPESLLYRPLLDRQPRLTLKGELIETEAKRLQEWLRANPN